MGRRCHRLAAALQPHPHAPGRRRCLAAGAGGRSAPAGPHPAALLQGIAADLEHYWHAKRGPRSTAAFRAAITQLTPLVLERGPLQIAAFLNAAAQAGYPQLDYGRWEARERGFAQA